MSRKLFRRGNYSVIAAFGLPVILGFAAIVVDMSRIQIARQEINMAAESIAHSALISMKHGDDETTIRNKAKKTGKQNQVDGDMVTIRANKHIYFGNWDFTTKKWAPSTKSFNSVKVVYGRTPDHREGPLDMMLTPFLGTNYVNISEENASVAAFRPRDMCVVMDVTASFAGEMPEAKKAALSLLDTMNEQYLTGDQICMVVFVGDSEVFTTMSDIQRDIRTVKAKWNGDYWGKSGKVLNDKQWYYQKPGSYWGWTGAYVNVWDGTYTKVFVGNVKEARTRRVFSHWFAEPYKVTENYVTTENYTVRVRVPYTETYTEDYTCKKKKTIREAYTESYVVNVPYMATYERTVPYNVTEKYKEAYQQKEAYTESYPYKYQYKENYTVRVKYNETYSYPYTYSEKYQVRVNYTEPYKYNYPYKESYIVKVPYKEKYSYNYPYKESYTVRVKYPESYNYPYTYTEK